MNYFITFFLLLISPYSLAKNIKKYNFNINTKKVNFTGQWVEALTVGGQIPAPLIKATVGDTLEVTFNNKMDQETSIHWHGVLLPNDQDGVSYLNTKPIAPKSSFTYSFKVKHSGTYWYHSHTGLQEQRGVYGPLVFYPKRGKIRTNYDKVVVLSDWTNENPKQVLAHIKKDPHYYSLKKGTVVSWLGALGNGFQGIKNKVIQSAFRMEGMDLSDVGYDAFLINGQRTSFLKVTSRQRVRLRLINASASTYFNVEFSGKPMQIIEADGMKVKPLFVKRLQMAIAETYDVIVHIPDKNIYELRATAQDGTGHSSLFIGSGKNKILAPKIKKPNLYLMGHMPSHSSMNSKMCNEKHCKLKKSRHHKMPNMPSHSSMNSKMCNEKHCKLKKSRHHKMPNMPSHSSMNSKMCNEKHCKLKKSRHHKMPIQHMTNYRNLRALKNTNFSNKKIRRKVSLDLTGNMNRYVWGFNNKTLRESDKILIKKGEVVQFILNNKTMMSHPIHLHGHFFRVLNGQKKRSPLKHTVNVPAMDKVIIEFEADQEKDWFFHCHNLYHMKSGMSRVISYQKTSLDRPDILKKISSDPFYFMTHISLLSQMSEGVFQASSTRNIFQFEYDWNYKKEYDLELSYARNISDFLNVYIGIRQIKEIAIGEKNVFFGLRYTLPFLIDSDFSFNRNWNFRLKLSSHLQLSTKSSLEWFYKLEFKKMFLEPSKDYGLSLSYELNKKVSILGTYDSDFKWGAGMGFRF